jgi:site-specific recombinase XerD
MCESSLVDREDKPMKISVPYFRWRDGRPRWEPGPALRKAGHKGKDLRAPDGAWLAWGDAIEEARAINAAIADASQNRNRMPPVESRALAHAWASLTATPEFRALAQNTRSDYIRKASVFLAWAGDAPLSQLRRKTIRQYWRVLQERRGHAMANGVIAVLRLTLSHAVDEEWIAVNPASNLRMKSVAPRVVFWSDAECAAMLDAADELGEHGIGDAIVLALHTGQRQSDILALPAGLLGNDGMVRLEQRKTKSLVAFPATGILVSRLAAAERRNAAQWLKMRAEDRTLILDDRTGRRFNRYTFGHRFAEIRKRATLIEPGCLQKQFLDFRDTALTRLYMAGLTILQIAAISGHEIRTVDQVLRHYVALNASDGRAAIAAYETWLKERGAAVLQNTEICRESNGFPTSSDCQAIDLIELAII